MNYQEISQWCAAHSTTLKAFASELGFTAFGFRQAVERETMPVAKLRLMCAKMKLTPNQVLGIAADESDDALHALIQQLKTKDEQIKMLLEKHKEK